ncbi:hypothetical protein QRX60_29630 [Amycolatopsis mongoliensis]|uniref:Beta galactosidase small chain/ domain-containing protein n=1 Tax=Amycolatopsis mongoliensis TaxID=715475 RepID=A0A9Y2JGJ7_9PSEU|nr:hypothetical protein [Amycolatopsis sp. 4-36]WIX98225.1 hypothetical protein QRX60_29630 [Amycolatopsis sp. 4-36]
MFNLAARRWSDQQPAAACHPTELPPEPRVHLHTDHAVQDIGTGAARPGVLPQHRLEVRPAEFALTLTPVSGRLAGRLPGRARTSGRR